MPINTSMFDEAEDIEVIDLRDETLITESQIILLPQHVREQAVNFQKDLRARTGNHNINVFVQSDFLIQLTRVDRNTYGFIQNQFGNFAITSLENEILIYATLNELEDTLKNSKAPQL